MNSETSLEEGHLCEPRKKTWERRHTAHMATVDSKLGSHYLGNAYFICVLSDCSTVFINQAAGPPHLSLQEVQMWHSQEQVSFLGPVQEIPAVCISHCMMDGLG